MTPAAAFRPVVAMLMATLALGAGRAHATSILFIGNSFTYGQGASVHEYRANTVTDLNGQGVGGLPALFKSFTLQAGLSYDVALETQAGVGLDWHLAHKSEVIGQRPYDNIVMHGFSTLDRDKPGDPALLVETVRRMSALLRARNPAVEIRLMATWPRADQIHDANGAWHGQPLEAMARDLRAGYDLAAAGTPGLRAVIPVGEAWIRAIREGVADASPYDGIDSGKVDLWTTDHYHASNFGYYLEALVVFGSVTGLDPRSLGENECSGFDLGLTRAQVAALERIAFEQLVDSGGVKPVRGKWAKAKVPSHCAAAR